MDLNNQWILVIWIEVYGYNFIVFQVNIRSPLAHQNELNELLNRLENKNSKLDILLLCKTNLNKNTTARSQFP